jgi:hypothetical protein
MKTGKLVSRMTALLLVFFLITAGAAQALNISECKEKCCQGIPEKSHYKGSANRLSDHPPVEFESLVLLCDPIQKFRTIASKTPEQENCHDGTGPSCCEMAQASNEVEGLISTAQARSDRPLDIGPVCILPETHATDNTFITISARYSIPARATPPPLYLKNSAFLC